MVSADHDLGAVSEMALSAESFAEFTQRCFSYLNPLVGFDAACSMLAADDGTVRQLSTLGYSHAQLLRDIPRFLDELSPSELLGFASDRSAVDLDVLAPQRRARLAVYRELLVPFGVSLYVGNIWQSRFGVFALHLARTGPVRPFRRAELARLHLSLPSIRLGQALLASNESAIGCAPGKVDWWESAWNLSERERDTVALVARGFRNGEIAKLLRISANTVRNHLASVFRKADVSTRAELVFLMMSSDPADEMDRRSGRSRPWCAVLTKRYQGRVTAIV